MSDPTSVVCPVCDAWIGWACNGPGYGYHAAGYHHARIALAAIKSVQGFEQPTEARTPHVMQRHGRGLSTWVETYPPRH